MNNRILTEWGIRVYPIAHVASSL